MSRMSHRPGLGISPRSSQKLTRRIMLASFFLSIAIGAGVVINLSSNKEALAAAIGDYRSVANGTWSVNTTWQTYNGVAWVGTLTAPTSANATITIQTGHTVNVTGSLSVDQLVIEKDATLNINGGTLTIANGLGTDVTVNGTMNIARPVTVVANSTIQVNNLANCNTGSAMNFNAGSTITIGSTAIFTKNAGTVTTTSGIWIVNGKYVHNDQTAIPIATWNTGSTIELKGVNNTLPANFTQSFYHFIWNSASQTGSFNLDGTFQTVNGDFTLESTGTGDFQLDWQGNNALLNIGGNFYMKGGTMFGCTNGSTSINVSQNYVQTGGLLSFSKAGGTAYGNSSTILTVFGNALISGGVMDMSQCTANNPGKGLGVMYLKKNIYLSASGIVTETSALSRGQINFNGSIVQYYSSINNDNVTRYVDFVVSSGAILRTDTQIITGWGNFTVDNGGGLMIGDANGITKTAALGNIQVTGTRTYNTGADYTYIGTTDQNTGDGLPSQVRNLTFDNLNNITLTNSSAVSGILYFNSGVCIATSDTLTLGINAFTVGTLTRVTGHVHGYFRRWIAAALTINTLFPVGTLTNYNPVYFSFTTAPVPGSIVCRYMRQNPGTLGLPVMDAGLLCQTIGWSYWDLAAMNSFSGGLYTVRVDANGFPNVDDYSLLHLLRRDGSGSPWTPNGVHAPGTGSNSSPQGNRTGMNLLGHYGITSSWANPLPIELIGFNAKANSGQVDLTWSTASETNNDYFSVERSSDGINFSVVLTQRGAGNSTMRLEYKDTDNNPLPGASYYRLRQTDFDGNTTVSKPVVVYFKNGISEDDQLKIISVTRFTQNFTLKYSSKENTPVRILILNIGGKLIYETTLHPQDKTNSFEYFDEKNLPAGVYFIQVISDGQKCVQKIVKEI